MGTRFHIAQYLDVDVDNETFHCHECGQELGPVAKNYKEGCLIYERDPRTVHRPLIEGTELTFAPDPEWCRILEFYCPGCGQMFDNEYLPPGHPITHDIVPDIEAIRRAVQQSTRS
ncbi:MAG: acetophenone carboxylase [Chloroflexota bacterium]|nr:MAG: acetophenone carboxylase [Chloroflexota bacterium]